LQAQGLHARESCTKTQVEFRTSSDRVALGLIKLYRVLRSMYNMSEGLSATNTQKRGPGDLRSFDVAEPRTADSKSRVDLQCNIPYLSPDVLTLAITIRPDVKNLRISCLRLDVTCYGLFVLTYHEHEFRGFIRKTIHWSTYLCNETMYGSVEQICWWT
jgi:hypothetical protein